MNATKFLDSKILYKTYVNQTNVYFCIFFCEKGIIQITSKSLRMDFTRI